MQPTDLQTAYQKAIQFSAAMHAASHQTIPSTNLPYVVHLSNVAMEILVAAQNTPVFDPVIAVQVALLHDVLEDTPTNWQALDALFGTDIADAVQALTKNSSIPADEKMLDSLARIKKLPKEVWAVKLADRITNLQVPPSHWAKEKIATYQQEAMLILKELEGGNVYLEKRLAEKIAAYAQYL